MWIKDIIEVLNLLYDGKTEWHKLINKIENNSSCFQTVKKLLLAI